ncbi:hypothetical protein V8E52_006311 [Russula decolorans]|jgi:hypothetical protein
MMSLLFSALLWALQGVESIWGQYIEMIEMNVCVCPVSMPQVPNGVQSQLIGYKAINTSRVAGQWKIEPSHLRQDK